MVNILACSFGANPQSFYFRLVGHYSYRLTQLDDLCDLHLVFVVVIVGDIENLHLKN